MERKKVLVIEDNELNMKLVRGLLTIGKHDMIEAFDAETGIELARKHRPDLILMDIQLPGINGLEATQIIRSEPVLRHIPIVALTSYAMQGDDLKAKSAGCNGYITKPINVKTFLPTINKFFKTDAEQVGETADHNYKYRILIVDDEPLNVKLLSAKLSSDTYEVQKAYNGQSALNIVSEHPPDIILLDIMMPGMDGYEVISRLKGDPATKHIPIILITALNGKDDKKRGLETGADEFLNKPVNTAELRTRVASLLRLKEYQEQINSRNKTIRLILRDEKEEETIEEEPLKQTVLIVEDRDPDARLIQAYLSRLPCRVRRVSSGEKALSMANNENIDLILLDIMLPDLDGFEVCRRLKENDKTLPVQVVMMTSLNDMKNKIRGIELGTDDYLVKPINKDELRARVRALLKKKDFFDKLKARADNALQAAITDELTGIYNHAYFKHFLELEIKRAARQNNSIALIMIDADNFKSFNDTHGHLAGDNALRTLGKLIRDNLREVDLPARYGGEEFALVLPYAGKKDALGVAERLLNIIRATEVKTNGSCVSPVTISVSMGISFYPMNAGNFNELIQAADSALYRAKKKRQKQNLHVQ